MKKLLFFLLFLHASLSALIQECPHFSQVTQFIQPDTLVILDIDDTLLVPVQTLGSDAWFLYRVKQNEESGMHAKAAFERSLAEWEAVRHITKMKIVEEGTEKLISEWQEKGFKIMGLTTQGLALATRTLHQLSSVGIDLTKTAPCHSDHYFLNPIGILYRQGLLFTAGTGKGKGLLMLLDHIGFHPKRILFVNDKEKHLKDLEGEVERRQIEFIGLRYSFCDERIKAFDPKIAEIQWQHSTFHHLLSDDEAKNLLQK